MKKQFSHSLSLESLRFVKFIIVGSVNSACGYAFYVAFLYVGIPYIISGTLSFVTGIFFNYFVTRRFVFGQPTHKHTLIYYFFLYGVLYFFGMAWLWLFVDIFKMAPYLAGFLSLPINAMVAFVFLRTIVFRQGDQLYG